MSVTRVSLAVSILLLIAAAVGFADEEICVVPYKPDPPIAVDGSLQDWAEVPGAITVRGAEHATYGAGNWTGDDDLSGLIHLAWRYEGLYLGVEVTDDVVTQTQRGLPMFRGDHLELFLDLNPDPESPRSTWGPQQFQFAFSPGNFAGTGDPLFDILPEAYPYAPPGLTIEGVKLAALRTPRGYNLEAFVPFSLVGLANPAPDTLIAGEVALSDTDSVAPAQESFLTISTAPWAHDPSRFILFLLGDAAGKATVPPRRVAIRDAVEIKAAQSAEIAFDAPPIPEGKDAYLFFRARINFSKPAGYHANALRLSLNGQAIDGPRLSNRPPASTMRRGDVQTAISPAGDISLPYGPDFTAIDGHEQYALLGVKAHEYEFRVTDLLKAGSNVLRFESLTAPIADRDIVVGGVALLFKAPPPPPKPKRPAPTGPLPFIYPGERPRPEFSVDSTQPGRLEIAVGGERFTVESRFSSPDGKWQQGSCAHFTHQRRVERLPEAVLVFDRFTNLTDENLPIIQRYTCDLRGRLQKAWVAGLSPASGAGSVNEPANPSTYAATGSAGLGLLALNDEFMVHAVNSFVGSTIALADDSFVLRPGASYTAEWAVIPTDRPDFWDFVNAARRLRNVNFELKYQFAFLRAGPPTDQWSDEAVRSFLVNKGTHLSCASISYPKYEGRYPHGTAFQLVDHSVYARHNDRLRTLCPDLKTMIYFHCFIDVLDDSPAKYAKDRVLLPDGAQADYGDPHDRIFFPTLTNDFGRDVAKNIDLILGDCKAEGVYWDEIEYSRYRYHYGEPWDGCSADIDPNTHRIARLKSSVALITQPFRLFHVRRLLERGPLIANGMPHTRTMADVHFGRFVETGSISNCSEALLYAPVALGDHLTERTEEDAYRVMLAALDYGCLYNWYSDLVIPTRKNLACYMFPITPVELHEGYVIGKERIITKVSGCFGWSDNSSHEVHVFDGSGREVPDFAAPTLVRDGMTFTELRLPEDYSAAIIRH
jgi:hypothetical protein